MTDIAVTELTVDEARALTDEIRRDASEIKANFVPKVKRAFFGRADKVLDYESWDAYSADVLGGVRIPVGERPAMVAELRQAGMSQRAIGAAIGVDEKTVRNDLSRADNSAPAVVAGLDGKQYTPPPPPAERFDKAVADFPELEHYADRPTKATALADQLRTFEPTERAARRETLAKVIQAEQDGRLAPKPDPAADAVALADRLFIAANEAAQTAEKVGGVEAMAAAVVHADSMQIELWRDQFTELADLCNRIADACRPKLRRVQ